MGLPTLAICIGSSEQDIVGRVLFLCPDQRRPAGGVRKIYEFANTLREGGLDAAVVHRSDRFRPTWFASDVRTLAAASTVATQRDLVVLPELWGDQIPALPGIPKLILNQNHFIARDRFFAHPEIVGIVVVSDHAFDFCRLAYPGQNISRIRVGISEAFDATRTKDLRLAYMPRRRAQQAERLLAALERNGSLQNWTVTPIDGMSATEVASVLATSAVFLSFSRREGFGLPPLEAMASGCLVIGYHGLGGREFFDERWCFPIAEDDMTAYLDVATHVLSTFERERERYVDMGQAAASMVATRYSPPIQAADVMSVFEEALERTAVFSEESSIKLHTVRPRPSPTATLRRAAHTWTRRSGGRLPAWSPE